MKTFTWIVLGLGLALSACQPPSPAHTLRGQWQFMAYENLATGQRTWQPEHVPQAPIGNFDDQGRRGKFRIETNTNAIWGRYQMHESGSFETTEIDGTLFADNRWTTDLWSAMEDAHYYQVDSRFDTMRIVYDGDKRLIWARVRGEE